MLTKVLEGKVALVTGAGSPTGLGRAMSEALVLAGARVAMVDVKGDWLEQSANDVRELAGDDAVMAVEADVSDPASAEAAIARVVDTWGLHILVNNAGINPGTVGLGPNGPVDAWENSLAAWDKVISVNLSGPFYITKAAMGHFLEQGWGRIIGVTTSFETMIRKGNTPYGPAKAGHEALMSIIAKDLEGTGVTANVLVPGGPTNTAMLPDDGSFDREALIQPDVMRNPVVWLASDASDGVNGQRFVGYMWDDTLSLEETIEKAGAPVAWPNLRRPYVAPGIRGARTS
ncbi:MAG: SDR family oxidoreductase [Dehalococcoidia bacterium]|nr:SDR family oxidoreductase [Dehalococcoidia bacterium]